MRVKISIVFLSILCAFFSWRPEAQGPIQGGGTQASQIIQRVLQDSVANQGKKAGLKYRQSSVVTEYEPDGKPRNREEDSKTVDGTETNFEIACHKIDPYEILATSYDFRLAEAGDSTIIEFFPKPGLKFSDSAKHFTNRLRGKIWINTRGGSSYISRLEGSITEEFSLVYWGRCSYFIPVPITIKGFWFTINWERLESGTVVEKSIKAAVAFDSIRDGIKEYAYTYDSFEYKNGGLRPLLNFGDGRI